ncbi:MAG: RidA family protein [Caulobacteraceae bacterium]
MAGAQILLPAAWPRPKGYANGVLAEGRTVFVAGQIGWDETERLVADDFAGQFRQVLINTLAVLGEAGACAEHVCRMTWFVTSRDEYLAALPAIGRHWRELMGHNFPAMSVVAVAALVEAGAKVEIETTAVIPLAGEDPTR